MQSRLVEITKKISTKLWPPVFLGIVSFGTFFTTLVLNIRSFYLFPDNIDQAHAWYQKLAVSVHQGVLPLWDANTNSGHSFVGDLITGVFYPLNLIWVWLFGSVNGIDVFWLELIVVFHFWLAAVGMYLAARSFGLGKLGSLASGMVFAFGGVIAVRSVSQTVIFLGLCLIPWAVYAFNVWLRNKAWWALTLCGLALGLIVLAGHIQPWYHAIMLIGLLAVLRNVHPGFGSWLKALGKRLLGVVGVVLLSLFFALPQLIVTVQYLPQAVRFVGDAQPISPSDTVSFETFTKTYAYPISDTLSLIDPAKFPVIDGNELYVGLIGLALIIGLFAVFRVGLKDHTTWRLYSWFLGGTTALSFVIMIGFWTFIPAVMRHLPLISQIRQLGRYSILIHFCLAILVGVAFEVWVRHLPQFKQNKTRLILALAVVAFLAVNSAYLLLLSLHGNIDKHFAYQSLILTAGLGGALLFARYAKQILFAAITASVLVASLWFMPRVITFEPSYPPNYYRNSAALDFLGQHYGTARVWIEDGSLPPNIGNVYDVQTLNGYGATMHEPFYKYLNQPDPEGQTGRHLDLMNVRYIASKKDHPELRLVLKDEDRGLNIYERDTWAPRAYLKSQQEACIVHSADCSVPVIDYYSDSAITLTYESSKADQLVLAEVNFTGWKAQVDGVDVTITSYDPTGIPIFRMIDVPAGRHVVEFKYDPFNL